MLRRQYNCKSGVDPNWRHIIPPRQENVLTEGHCIATCTKQVFDRHGIQVFAVMSKTHSIGKQVKLRQVSLRLFYFIILL